MQTGRVFRASLNALGSHETSFQCEENTCNTGNTNTNTNTKQFAHLTYLDRDAVLAADVPSSKRWPDLTLGPIGLQARSFAVQGKDDLP